jgi:hypothetical protein
MPYASDRIYRYFNMDMKGVKLWEWVGGKTPLLVYGEGGVAPDVVTGQHLFSNVTYGFNWSDGYEALAVLDVDLSGWVEGREMEELFLWYDRNTDAKVQPGEMVPASSEVRRLSVKREYQAGKKSPYSWAERLDGVKIHTWDWVSQQGYSTPTGYWGVQVAPGGGGASPLMYRWTTPAGWHSDTTRGFGGAVLRWVFVGKEVYVYSSSWNMNNGNQLYSKVRVTPKGDSYELSWQWIDMDSPTTATLLSDGVLIGRTPREDRSVPGVEMEYMDWEARFVPDSDFYFTHGVHAQLLSLASPSQQALEEALTRTDMLQSGRFIFKWAVEDSVSKFSTERNLYEELKARGF